MSEFQSLDQLVAAGQEHAAGSVSKLAVAVSAARAGEAPAPQAAVSRRSRRTTKPEKKNTRLTAFPENASLVNQNDLPPASDSSCLPVDRELQVAMAAVVMTSSDDEYPGAAEGAPQGAGGQDSPNPVNHAQVVVPPEFPDEIRMKLAEFGVNLRGSQLGRKYVLDDFLRGRLVSLLALGPTLRQSAAALGLSHNAIWKELKKNQDLSEQVNAARFQTQIEPLMVILRASKLNWRAPTWLIHYLNKSLARREQAGDEQGRYDKEAAVEPARQRADQIATDKIEMIRAGRRVTEELRR